MNASTPDSAGLRVQSLCAGYGSKRVLHDVEFEVRRGESLAVLGPNGAGKTTLARTIAGLLRPMSGSVEVDGTSVSDIAGHRVVRSGVTLLPEGRQIVPNLSVVENLLIGGHTCPDRSSRLDEILEIFPLLATHASKRGTDLSGGQQQLLALGRALMSRPRYLIMDEPSLGLAPIVIDQVAESVERLRGDESIGLVVIEQNLGLAARLAQRALVLRRGRVARTLDGASLNAEALFEEYVA